MKVTGSAGFWSPIYPQPHSASIHRAFLASIVSLQCAMAPANPQSEGPKEGRIQEAIREFLNTEKDCKTLMNF